MYVAPAITDLGSFQELTLGMNAAVGGTMGPIGSLLDTVGTAVKDGLNQLPGVSVDDNGTHVGTDGVKVNPKITITPR